MKKMRRTIDALLFRLAQSKILPDFLARRLREVPLISKLNTIILVTAVPQFRSSAF